MGKNKVDFFFCGDSFTWGEELQGPEDNHEKREKERFSGVLSSMLNKTHVNISRSGTSNDWIVKNTIEWFEKGNTCDTAIIQFSHHYRWIWYDKTGKPHHMPAKKDTDPNHRIKPPKREALKAYSENISSRYLAADNYWKNMFLLRNYLKGKCKIVHLSLTTIPLGVIGEDYKKNFWYNCNDKVKIFELTPFLRGDEKNFCPRLNTEVLDENYNNRFWGSHPSAIGHYKIAERIMSTLSSMT